MLEIQGQVVIWLIMLRVGGGEVKLGGFVFCCGCGNWNYEDF